MGQKKKEEKGKGEKPLEDRTIKELRDEALAIPDVQGVHGMNREELLAILRKAKGMPEPEKKKRAPVRDIKAKIKQLKETRDEVRAQAADRARLDILRKKISKLKKQTRD
jgi:hypothetical protein